mmetsp:Transcript_18659/g.59977  ORF Transcript_18659/g.59977 Transcript_18659/m.59977 type:complete len:217 (+) Transcript_18659:288-938(+)
MLSIHALEHSSAARLVGGVHERLHGVQQRVKSEPLLRADAHHGGGWGPCCLRRLPQPPRDLLPVLERLGEVRGEVVHLVQRNHVRPLRVFRVVHPELVPDSDVVAHGVGRGGVHDVEQGARPPEVPEEYPPEPLALVRPLNQPGEVREHRALGLLSPRAPEGAERFELVVRDLLPVDVLVRRLVLVAGAQHAKVGHERGEGVRSDLRRRAGESGED